jgi:ferrochelatase
MKTAVILFNLGGPTNLAAVQPFLTNMFSDRAILNVPAFFRFFLARFIAFRRAPVAQEIYKLMGGKSPINDESQAQAQALQEVLASKGDYKVFFCHRYWQPMADEVIDAVLKYDPNEVVLLPLYPQYSTTTTASSFKQWRELAEEKGLKAKTREICCYPLDHGFVSANVRLIKQALAGGGQRIIFSAHGIPLSRVEKGDPYQLHVEASVGAIVKELGLASLDYVIAYQSKVGPLTWLEPSTEHEIKQAAIEKRPILIVPIAFVSEHSETLVELDIEYAHLYKEHGGPSYKRVATVRVSPEFIEGLAKLVIAPPRPKCSNKAQSCLIKIVLNE